MTENKKRKKAVIILSVILFLAYCVASSLICLHQANKKAAEGAGAK